MIRTLFKITAVFLVCFFILAAFHEAIPGLCLSQGRNTENVCPFCKLIHTLVLLVVSICFVSVQCWCSFSLLFVARVLSVINPACHLFRGPPVRLFQARLRCVLCQVSLTS
jgi:hypothetical protein